MHQANFYFKNLKGGMKMSENKKEKNVKIEKGTLYRVLVGVFIFIIIAFIYSSSSDPTGNVVVNKPDTAAVRQPSGAGSGSNVDLFSIGSTNDAFDESRWIFQICSARRSQSTS